MNITIKKAESKDWKVIQKLNNDVFESDSKNDDDLDSGWPFSKEGIRYYQSLANGEYGNCVIVWVGEKAVGYAAMSIKDFGYRKSNYVEIENMGVSPEYRSLGIGKKLIEEAKKWAKSQGINKLFVVAYYNNEKAVKFYRREGFEPIGLELQMDI